MHTIKELQSSFSLEVEKEIERLNQMTPSNLYEPVAYALAMGGKRLRPVMVLLSCDLLGKPIDAAMPAAMATEVFHNFTLLHDDIMDGAEMRRNQPSVYKKYSENVAILSGDVMSIMAYQYLQRSAPEVLIPMTDLFSQTAREICEGQQFDMDFESRTDVSISEYLNMIRLKTAVLLACCLKLGAIAAKAPQQTADLLYAFGLNLGIAFQLQDDLLDVFADQDKFGKKIGGDIVSNKKTFLLLKALEISDDQTRKSLLGWTSGKDFDENKKIEAVTKIYNRLNIKSITESGIREFYQSALDISEEIDLTQESKNRLKQLAEMIMKRDH